jgi:hypothetical protein
VPRSKLFAWVDIGSWFITSNSIRMFRAGFIYQLDKLQLRTRLQTCDTRAQNGTREVFPNTQHSLLSHFLFHLPHHRRHIAHNMCIYTHVWLRTDCISITVATKHFYSNLSGAKCSLDIYRCGAGLTVTGPTRDIGQNVLQAAFGQEAAAAAQLLPLVLAYRISWGHLDWK